MKYSPKNLAFVILAVVTSGCSTTNPAPDSFDPKVFSSGQKGVVILRVVQHAPGILNSTDIGQSYDLVKIGTDKKYSVSEANSPIPGIYNTHDYSSNVMMLDPGVYCIDSLSLNNQGNFRRWYPGPGVKRIQTNKDMQKYLIRIGAFEVKPGKVSYFGYLKLPDSGKFPFEVNNEITKAKADLKNKELGDLADKLEFQPFHQAGSVYIESQGNKSFISRDEMESRVMQYIEKSRQNLDDLTSPK